MNVLPWRVRKVISDRLPLLYHVVRNGGFAGNSEAHWDGWLADTWDDRRWPTKIARIEALTERSQAILDVGCGTGTILRGLAAAGYTSLHGLELSGYACRRLEREGIPMSQGSLLRLPMQDASFDVVIASQVLEHVIRRRRFVAEIERVLKPKGRAFVFVPDDCLGPIDESEHVIKYDRRSLARFLEKTFDVESIESMREVDVEMCILFACVRKRSP